jgi:hypothetical protein
MKWVAIFGNAGGGEFSSTLKAEIEAFSKTIRVGGPQ